MPYVILALCAVVCTFFLARLLVAKTCLVEKAIEDTIARKLSAAAPKVELERLREENGVMRNLLIDMVENEGASSSAKSQMSAAESKQAMNARMQRRREIFGEAVYLLRQTEKSRTGVRIAITQPPES
ncbi:hypothetical protein DTW90_35785 [Neorhizobium sp. P12A]|jgi:hypothetical protein|uniref:hypothetical protein n=1 Tax=Neorhizobium sp. P12A TaxID=2268027 RepID=UPI0011EEB578|nr:hypothetical protein [Neorhizobium sp. P12A]KAA0684821.1 hypothetical protein DTW90_35785 [Neorhizobium sp. P12A]